ncbi:ABC transporter permease [Glycomyces harbinensis]|uniref:Peptide/nickel transport system permease protein n=1 Tax=Glycomyces harbinensis TaxID=58114 RepID=A0A1G7AG67_9ACTN|nr:ABC transporter permease [Glycomyces harbinensis]SDE13703.1 peptide/nickel transport system permease protein [Glycomyces harbinensis]
MTTTTPVSPRSLRWARRRQSFTRSWNAYRSQRTGMIGLFLLAAIVILALAAPILVDESQLSVTQATGGRMEPPSAGFPLGTDEVGRSILALTLWGARLSLLIGLTATVVAILVGTAIGVTAGHIGGWYGWIALRFSDWFMVLPSLVVAIALLAVLGRSMSTTILVIAMVSWSGTTRLVRAQTLTVQARPYLERAKALGAGHWHQMTKHILPNVLPLVLASATLLVPSAILMESSLAWLGLGDPNVVSWGSILNRASSNGAVSAHAWWYLLPPGLAILLVVLAFMMCGRALEAVFNPRLRGEQS